jgi:integrase
MPGTPSIHDSPSTWDAWFRQWSLPLAAVTDDDLQAFMDDVANNGPDGRPRQLAPSSLARTKAVVQGAFTYAVKRRLIEWNPWAPVHIDATDDQQRIDPDLVMDPAQVMAVAQACARIDPRYFAYVLIQGLCGLRPGEAGELRRHDLHPRRGTPQTLRLRASRTTVSERYILNHETRRRPLKGHGERFTRSVPILPRFAPVLLNHLDEFVGPEPDARVFTTATGQPIHPSNFQRDVWRPAREEVFAADHPLRGARRHDLRHSAITAWLNAGVPLKTAQAWSGHKTLSVLLDTYAGVLESDELVAQQRLDTLLDRFYNQGSVTPR